MAISERKDYEQEARLVADRIGLRMSAVFHGDRCPPWDDARHIHGDRYRITLSKGGHRMTFDFWNSQADMEAGKAPGYYDVLSSISSDMNAPTDPDEVAAEYGDMRPSQAIAVARFAKRLRAFFAALDPDELTALEGIQ